MKKTITITIGEETLQKLRKIKEVKGVPISRSLEIAFTEFEKEEGSSE